MAAALRSASACRIWYQIWNKKGILGPLTQTAKSRFKGYLRRFRLAVGFAGDSDYQTNCNRRLYGSFSELSMIHDSPVKRFQPG